MMALLLTLALSAPQIDDHVYGAPLLPGAHEESEAGRYMALRNYDDVLEFYEKLFKGNAKVRFRKIVNQPTVKATHLQNLAPSVGGWAGINIYEVNGRTYLYFLKAEPPPKRKSTG